MVHQKQVPFTSIQVSGYRTADSPNNTTQVYSGINMVAFSETLKEECVGFENTLCRIVALITLIKYIQSRDNL